MNNLFIEASRKKLRFPSPQGELTVEHLWDLPLTSTVANKANLNEMAKTVNKLLGTATEDNFVKVRSNPAKTLLEMKLSVIVFVIRVKEAEAEAALEEKARQARRGRLLEALGNKDDERINKMTEEQLLAELSRT